MIFKKILIINIRKLGIYLYLKLIYVSFNCYKVVIFIYMLLLYFMVVKFIVYDFNIFLWDLK